MPIKISTPVLRLLPLLLALGAPLQAATLPSVTVTTLTQQKVAQPSTYLGRIEALQAVDVVARTEGVVAKRLFKDGENVQAGQLLFEIEAGQQRAALARSQAQVNNAAAQVRNARQHLNRLLQLGVGTAVSQSELDSATASRDMALAALKEAEARLKTERLNLDYTLIAAPISGRAGHSTVHEGTLIGAGYGRLVTLKQLDPVRVVIAVNERDYLASQKSLANDLKKANEALTPTLQLANGDAYPFSGHFVSLDNHIDSKTGTVAMRLEFANPQHVLLPGGVVNVHLMPQQQEQVLLPAAALQQDSEGYFVLKVGSDEKVEIARIALGGQIGPHYVVTTGVTAGDRVIVAGMQRVRPGMQVSASEAR